MAFTIFDELTWVALNGVSTSVLNVIAYPNLQNPQPGQASVSLPYPLTTSTDGTDPGSNITEMAQLAITTSPIGSIVRVQLNTPQTTPIHRLVVVGWQPANDPAGAPGIAAAAFDSSGNLLGGASHNIFITESQQGKREDDPPVFNKLLYGNVQGSPATQADLTPTGSSSAQAVPVSTANANPCPWNPGTSVTSFSMAANNGAPAVANLANPLEGGAPLLTDYVLVTNNQRIACFGFSNNQTNDWGFLEAISGGMDTNY